MPRVQRDADGGEARRWALYREFVEKGMAVPSKQGFEVLAFPDEGWIRLTIYVRRDPKRLEIQMVALREDITPNEETALLDIGWSPLKFQESYDDKPPVHVECKLEWSDTKSLGTADIEDAADVVMETLQRVGRVTATQMNVLFPAWPERKMKPIAMAYAKARSALD